MRCYDVGNPPAHCFSILDDGPYKLKYSYKSKPEPCRLGKKRPNAPALPSLALPTEWRGQWDKGDMATQNLHSVFYNMLLGFELWGFFSHMGSSLMFSGSAWTTSLDIPPWGQTTLPVYTPVSPKGNGCRTGVSLGMVLNVHIHVCKTPSQHETARGSRTTLRCRVGLHLYSCPAP